MIPTIICTSCVIITFLVLVFAYQPARWQDHENELREWKEPVQPRTLPRGGLVRMIDQSGGIWWRN